MVAMPTLPIDSPATYTVNTGTALPRRCFGEEPPELNTNLMPVRYVDQFGMCQICALHCPVFTEPQSARLWRTACGRTACALCYQFERTRNAVRRVRANTIHHFAFMRQLEAMSTTQQPSWRMIQGFCSR
mgnify:CR=1 FL=1